ncbi:MAG: MBL fold metallo-hydrolase, partial [Bacilli bacterium]|nr:MBL fold metallo-hydrolase [Bacilli bacterium]
MEAIVLGSGSKGNSTLIKTEKSNILIDVGFSYKNLKEKLESVNMYPKDINYIFITHDHVDHIFGLSTFLKKHKPTLYISEKLSGVITYENTKYFSDENIIDDFFVKVFQTSHDATDSIGFLIEEKEESLVYITDTGYINERNFIYLKNKTYYFIESNHDIEKLMNGSYPYHLKQRIYSDKGHLSNEACGMYLSKLIGDDTKKIILLHLSEENNTKILAYDAVTKMIESKVPVLVSDQKE